MREILQDNVIMCVIYDNCGSLPVNARELALALQNGKESENLLSCLTIDQGDMLSNIHEVFFP